MQKNSKYTLIKKAIKEQVAAGKYKTSALPDRREMAALFKTTTATCNKAVSELIRKGGVGISDGKKIIHINFNYETWTGVFAGKGV